MFSTISIILVSANALTLVYKGTVIGLSVYGFVIGGSVDDDVVKLWTTVTILLLSFPSLIMAMITTVGTNFRILVQHPALVLLPTFTFFSFQKIKGGCCGGEPDHSCLKKIQTCWSF